MVMQLPIGHAYGCSVIVQCSYFQLQIYPKRNPLFCSLPPRTFRPTFWERSQLHSFWRFRARGRTVDCGRQPVTASGTSLEIDWQLGTLVLRLARLERLGYAEVGESSLVEARQGVGCGVCAVTRVFRVR